MSSFQLLNRSKQINFVITLSNPSQLNNEITDLHNWIHHIISIINLTASTTLASFDRVSAWESSLRHPALIRSTYYSHPHPPSTSIPPPSFSPRVQAQMRSRRGRKRRSTRDFIDFLSSRDWLVRSFSARTRICISNQEASSWWIGGFFFGGPCLESLTFPACVV